MKGEMPMISGEEIDMLSRSARRVHRNVSGRAKAAKRSYARRVRQSVRLQVRNVELLDDNDKERTVNSELATKRSSSCATMVDERWAARIATDLAYAHRLKMETFGVIELGECTGCGWTTTIGYGAPRRQAQRRHDEHLRQVVRETIQGIGVESA